MGGVTDLVRPVLTVFDCFPRFLLCLIGVFILYLPPFQILGVGD